MYLSICFSAGFFFGGIVCLLLSACFHSTLSLSTPPPSTHVPGLTITDDPQRACSPSSHGEKISLEEVAAMNTPICIVTGADRGLGRALARRLAQRNARVVMLCRDRIRGEEAQREIVSGSGGVVELIVCDLADRKSVREAANEITRGYQRLDVLINNAAVFKRTRTVSPEGYELMFATNHLGPFLLTNFLLDLMKKSA